MHENLMMTSSNGNIFRVTGHLCGDFPAQRPVTRSFDVFFVLRLNKRLSKQPWGWWFETPSRSLWRHRDVKSSGKSCVAKQFTWCLGIALSDRSCLLSTFNPISVESHLIFNRTQCVVWKWFKGYKSRFCKTRYIHCEETVSPMNSPPPHPPPTSRSPHPNPTHPHPNPVTCYPNNRITGDLRLYDVHVMSS